MYFILFLVLLIVKIGCNHSSLENLKTYEYEY